MKDEGLDSVLAFRFRYRVVIWPDVLQARVIGLPPLAVCSASHESLERQLHVVAC